MKISWFHWISSQNLDDIRVNLFNGKINVLDCFSSTVTTKISEAVLPLFPPSQHAWERKLTDVKVLPVNFPFSAEDGKFRKY